MTVSNIVKKKTREDIYPTVPQPVNCDNPIDEYKDDAKLLELSNSSLCPFGNGDVTSFVSDLTYPVTFLEMAVHLVYYAEYDEKLKKYRYPFVEHESVIFQAFDIWNRKRMVQQNYGYHDDKKKIKKKILHKSKLINKLHKK